MTMSKVEECRGDSSGYEPIKQLSLNQLPPPKTPTKPLTSFNIEDILGVTPKNVTQESNNNNHQKATKKDNIKITRSTSPEHPEFKQRSKDLSSSKHHHDSNEYQHSDDNNSLSNNKKRIHDNLNFFTNLTKSPRHGKSVEDYRTASVAAAAAVASINPNNFFSSPFGCFPKTLLQGFIPPFNLNHLSPQQHQQQQQLHIQQNILSHSDHHQHNHHHHHHQQQQQQHSPSFIHQQHHSPVNLTTGTQNIPNAKIIRPWDSNGLSCNDGSSPSPLPPKTPPSSLTTSTTPQTAIITSEDSFDSGDDEDEEISVDDEDPPAPSVPSNPGRSKVKGDSVSPLDALMAMTSKTFAGLDNSGGTDPKRRDQTVLFGKNQPPKKRRKSRTAFTNQQIYELEKRFLYQKYLTPADRDEIAISLGLSNAQVITWFQNRRAKLKRDLEELKNDVTAAKKVPVPRNITGSVTEIELRRIQERTLRESFCNGGLQSPSSCSMASLSDDHETGTPIHSPEKADSDRVHVDVVTSDLMETEYSMDNNNTGMDGNSNHRNPSENHDNTHDINDNQSSASLSPRENRDNGHNSVIMSDCSSIGSGSSGCGGGSGSGRCEMDSQKRIKSNSFPVELPSSMA